MSTICSKAGGIPLLCLRKTTTGNGVLHCMIWHRSTNIKFVSQNYPRHLADNRVGGPFRTIIKHVFRSGVHTRIWLHREWIRRSAPWSCCYCDSNVDVRYCSGRSHWENTYIHKNGLKHKHIRHTMMYRGIHVLLHINQIRLFFEG